MHIAFFLVVEHAVAGHGAFTVYNHRAVEQFGIVLFCVIKPALGVYSVSLAVYVRRSHDAGHFCKRVIVQGI